MDPHERVLHAPARHSSIQLYQLSSPRTLKCQMHRKAPALPLQVIVLGVKAAAHHVARLPTGCMQIGEDQSVHGVQVWENLRVVSEQFPVAGNKGGSYLTMLSKGGFVFGIINIIGNFGTVYNDQVSACSVVVIWSRHGSSLTYAFTFFKSSSLCGQREEFWPKDHFYPRLDMRSPLGMQPTSPGSGERRNVIDGAAHGLTS